MTEIAEDTDTGPEDDTEDESEGLPEDTPARAMALLAEVESINAEIETKVDFKAFKDIGNKAKISPTQEDIPRPCTSAITENVANALLPDQTVRVQAHQVSDRKFVTVGRKRRKM